MIQSGKTINTGVISPDMAGDFLASLSVSPASVQTYKRSLRAFFAWLRERGIDRPVDTDVEAYQRDLQAAGRSASTVQGYVTAVRLFFQWTERADLYPDVARGVRTPKVEVVHRNPLTLPQVEDVLGGIDRRSVQGLRDYAMVALMASGGLGCQEVSQAKVGDFRPARTASVLVVPSRKRDGNVRLAGPVESALKAYLSARERASDAPLSEASPLFLSTSNNNRGGGLSPRAVGRIVKDALRGAGYDSGQLSAQSLKRTAGLLALIDAMQGAKPVCAPPRFRREFVEREFIGSGLFGE